jgi:hypothetical protein
MVEQLFGSKTRVKLLQLFFSNPNRSYYVREITRKIDEQINSVRRELANLLSIGIITSDTNNNRLYYEVDQKYEFYEPLSQIFGKSNTAKVKPTKKSTEVPSDTQEVSSIGNVELAVLTGHFTRDDSSGIDVLIVGDVNPTQLSKYIAELERQEAKELRYALMTPNEFKYRQLVNDRFISLISKSKNQVLVDKSDLMGAKASG